MVSLITTKFEYKGQKYVEDCMTDKLDRNYPDEGYAYFLREKMINGQKVLFEINIIKNGKYLTMKGYVNVFLSDEDNEPTDIIKCEVSFSAVFEYTFQAYPKNIVVRAHNPEEALAIFKTLHGDKTDYQYQGNIKRVFTIKH